MVEVVVEGVGTRDGTVSADGVGQHALVHGGAGDLQGAVTGGAAGIEEDAGVVGVPGLGPELTFGVQDGMGVAVEDVGGYVSGPEVLEDPCHGQGGFHDVDHDFDAGLVTDSAGHLHGGNGVGGGGAVGGEAHLDAEDDVAVFLDAADGLFFPGETKVFHVRYRQDRSDDAAHGGEVDEGQDPSVDLVNDVAPEATEVYPAGGAGIDAGGDAGSGANDVWVYVPGVQSEGLGAVDINKARGHQVAGGVDNPGGAFGGEVRGHGGYEVVLEGNVCNGIERLGGVYYPAALKEQVISEGHNAYLRQRNRWVGFKAWSE